MSEPQTLAPEVPNAEELARHFDALGHSVALINAVIAGEQLAEDRVTDEERKDTVKRNVDHLEIMKAKEGWWTTEDFGAVDAAITAGKAYIA